ncbi:hypothetical protein [Methylosinus sp. Sm6]|uniref:hypothetical protein n=1 Tax=Methylosinus sp. Sm6 TaxID=2866948 RepID=UPI001C99100A|nr:hypothetical protein [Methylosinus sp. Sm6]
MRETAAEPPSAPQFVDAAARRKTIELDYPVAYEGRTYTRIHLQRMTVREVADFIESIVGKDEIRFPLFRDDDGAHIPDAVLDGLDSDDRDVIDKAAVDFLPRRFRGVTEIASEPQVGDTIAQS